MKQKLISGKMKKTVIFVLIFISVIVMISCSRSGFAGVTAPSDGTNISSAGTGQENSSVPSPYTDEYKDKQARKSPR